MIRADFTRTGDKLTAFSLRGHAGYDDFGKDIVCASVTSAVQLTANAITEVLKVRADVQVLENEIRLNMPAQCPQEVFSFMEALLLHLEILAEDYEGTIKVKVSEV
ncbi:MAG: ribosomal-processing cysteine protease Prp [Oscillospiraceae bacterium]|nr:ribosomal-processing cysteine protease Prp [Oscillospiraceae bacterium]